MHLVEDDERRPGEMMGEQIRRGGDLLVGDHDAVDRGRPRAVGVAPPWIEMQPDTIGRVGPLRPQRGRGTHHHDLLAAAAPGGQARGDRLARARRGHEQEVRSSTGGVALQERPLPLARREAQPGRPPLTRLHGGQSAWPLAGSVAPPTRTGVT